MPLPLPSPPSLVPPPYAGFEADGWWWYENIAYRDLGNPHSGLARAAMEALPGGIGFAGSVITSPPLDLVTLDPGENVLWSFWARRFGTSIKGELYFEGDLLANG